MATVAIQNMTAEEFGIWWCRTENRDHRFDLVDGRPTVSPLSPKNPLRLPACEVLSQYAFANIKAPWSMSMFDDGLIVSRNPDVVLTPDLMLFLRSAPMTDFPPRVSDELPALVVEILPPDIGYTQVIRRTIKYIRKARVPLVWLLEPVERAVYECRLNSSLEIYEETDELTGNGVLPDFRCRVADLFTLPGQPPAASP